MRHLFLPTAAALLFTSTASANGESDASWPELDRELEALNESLDQATSGPRIWGYVRTNFAWSDEPLTSTGTDPYAGTGLDNVRLAVDGNVDRYSYRVSADAQAGTFQLLDAYADIKLGEELGGSFGQFKAPFLSSGLVEARDLLFITRTRNGVFASVRDQGLQVYGDHGRFHWALAGQNGADGAAQKALLTGRVSADIIGDPLPVWEGAYSSGDEARMMLAVAYQMDDAASDAGALALEATAIVHNIYVHGEIVDYGDDWTLDPNFPGEQRGGTTPWTIVTSWMLPKDRWEVALRYEDYDDVQTPQNFNRQMFTAGANYYVSGHNLKWQFNYGYGRNGGSDDQSDANIFAAGLTLGF